MEESKEIRDGERDSGDPQTISGEIEREIEVEGEGVNQHRGYEGGQNYYYSQQTAQFNYNYSMIEYQYPVQSQTEYQQSYEYHYPYQYGYHYPLQHMEGVPLPPGIPGFGGSTDPLEAVLGPFPCARLQNLPYDASLEEILVLFQGLVVIDVVLVGGGDAFVLFANPMDFQMALQRNRQTVGRRFIEISRASRSEYYEAVSSLHEQERGAKYAAAMRGEEGLRRGGSMEDQPSGETASAVAALWGRTSTSSSLPSLSAASQAGYVDTMNLGGGMPLSGRASGARDVGRSVLHAPLQKRSGGGIQVGEHTGFLRMRGLPFSAKKEDIFNFFLGYNPVQDSVVLTYRNDGRATGEAYIGFASPEDAERAMALHRRTMGSRYIELFISNKDEHGRAFARFGNR